MKKVTILFILVLFCLSCGKSETEVKGEIFVSTQGGQIYKLGAVPVNIYRKSTLEGLSKNASESMKPLLTTQTDSDGKFSAKLPYGEYTITSRAKRKFFETEERYYWGVDVKADSAETKVVLNNNNLELD